MAAVDGEPRTGPSFPIYYGDLTRRPQGRLASEKLQAGAGIRPVVVVLTRPERGHVRLHSKEGVCVCVGGCVGECMGEAF